MRYLSKRKYTNSVIDFILYIYFNFVDKYSNVGEHVNVYTIIDEIIFA